MAERFALVDVGQMDLDYRGFDRGESVADSNTSMRIGRRIDDNQVDVAARLLDSVN